MLKLRVPAGIGDISWCYSKLANLGETFHIYISGDNPRRSLEYVKMLPGVVNAEYDSLNFHQIVNRCLPDTTTKKDFIDLSTKSIQNFAVNSFLEKGYRIEDFMQEIPTNLHYNILTKEEDTHYAEKIIKLCSTPIGIYTSSYLTNSCWKGWFLHQWKTFLTEFKKTIPTATFIFIGADYDRPFSDDLSKILSGVESINIVGSTTIGQTIEVIRRLKYFVSFPCGLPVLANVMRVPTMMFYPPHLSNVINSWPDQDSISSGDYKGCEFPTPEVALEWLFKKYNLASHI